MLGNRYFGARYFGDRYWGDGAIVLGRYSGIRYFGKDYFGRRYFGTSAQSLSSDAADDVSAADSADAQHILVRSASDAIAPSDSAVLLLELRRAIERLGDRRNRPGRGPYSVGRFFRRPAEVFGGNCWPGDAADAGEFDDAALTVPADGAEDAVVADDLSVSEGLAEADSIDAIGLLLDFGSSEGSNDLMADEALAPDDVAVDGIVVDAEALDALDAAIDEALTDLIFNADAFDPFTAGSASTLVLVAARDAIDELTALLDAATGINSADINLLAEDAAELIDAAESLLVVMQRLLTRPPVGKRRSLTARANNLNTRTR
jgi:hypothetical protein